MKIFFRVAAVAALALSFGNAASAKSWRVNNDVTKGANFESINAAMSSEDVTDGDTLYMDPGCTLSSLQTISKSVTVIGSGYFLTDIPYGGASITGTLNIMAEHVKITGITVTGATYTRNNYITLERCHFTGEIRLAGYNRYDTIENGYRAYYWNGCYITIRQCFIGKKITLESGRR